VSVDEEAVGRGVDVAGVRPYSAVVCYGCRRPIREGEEVYVEYEVNPPGYVLVCRECERLWAALRGLERKNYIRCVPYRGIRLLADSDGQKG